jgi:UDP-N-acetylglucosamine 2-epimerase (non-hydrolysing)
MAPDVNLGLMTVGQTNTEFISRALTVLSHFIKYADMVIVQGDTASAFAGALAAFHRQIPIAHVEAGLRTYNLQAPFPEEGYRQMIDRIATKLYPPTEDALKNLHNEGLGDWPVTGNTGIDAALKVVREDLGASAVDADVGKFVLATIHRREATGAPAEAIERALVSISKHIPILMPVHPNGVMSSEPGFMKTCALPYATLIQTLRRATFVITDSGGIQEEAATFGIPMLICRTKTERMQIVKTGGAKLVGFDEDRIVGEALNLLDPVERALMSFPSNYYGDGRAGERIAEDLVG